MSTIVIRTVTQIMLRRLDGTLLPVGEEQVHEKQIFVDTAMVDRLFELNGWDKKNTGIE